MSLSLSRHRVEEFARLMDGEGRTDDPDLAPLVALAQALQAPELAPRPEFRDALRQRLVAVAAVQAMPEPEPTAGDRVRSWAGSWRTQRRLALAVAAAAALVVVGGVGVGASRSLPGEPLYGVKRVAERVQLATASGDYAKGQRHLQFARTRMSEVDALVGRNAAFSGAAGGRPMAAGVAMSPSATETIVSTLQDMNTETVVGANDLTRAYADGARGARAVLAGFAHSQQQDLLAVLPALPPAARAVATTSLALLGEVGHQAEVLSKVSCVSGSCSSAVTPGSSGPVGAGTTMSQPGSVGTTPLPGTSGAAPGPDAQPSGVSTAAPQQPSTGSSPGLPNVGVTSGSSTQPLPAVTLSPSPAPIVTLSPVPLPTVTLPPLDSTLSTLLSPSPSPTSTSLLPLPLPTLGGLGG